MKKISSFILRNLSVTIFIVVYFGLVVMHLLSDQFILENQLSLILTMLPFIIYGIALDYLIRKNRALNTWIRIIAQLLPLGIFIMQIVSTVYLYLGKESYDIFKYLIWLFLVAPVFITSYTKDGMRSRIINTAIGTGAFIVVYVFLTTQTKELSSGYGAMIYFITYFMMLYTAGGIKKIPYLGTVLGVLNALLLLIHRYVPITSDARTYGWEYDISFLIEMFIVITFIICIVIRLVEEFRKKPLVNE
ncbi:MAG TPA: hypothetical protein VN258_13605 [Mobilitalea sp.]|nr:hypothetical protein [Mobilitalea sp.]